MHHYRVTCAWRGSTAGGVEAYDRAHAASAPPAHVTLALSADPAFRGDPTLLNPEQLLVLAAASCQLLTFLSCAARARLEDTVIRAPFAGVVGLRKVSIGDYVDTGDAIVNLEQINPLKVDFRVAEVFLAAVRKGQAIEVSLDAFPGEHFSARFADIHTAMSGDSCPKCQAPLRVEKTIEIGNIFKLGTKYSLPLKAVYLDAQGQEKPIVMGSYGIGPARIIAAAVEQNHDPNGMIFPLSIAPFQVHLLPVNPKQGGVGEEAEKLYRELSSAGLETLFDDREEAPGVKFKDADLLGTPLRFTLSNKTMKERAVEVKERRSGQVQMVPRDQAVSWAKDWVGREMKK